MYQASTSGILRK